MIYSIHIGGVIMRSMKQDLVHTLLYQKEEEIFHQTYESELSFYELVKSGDLEGLDKRNPSLNDTGLGKLSNNEFRNLLYHFIVCVALITRFCIEGGLDTETAYTLSVLYIQKADQLHKKENLLTLHKEMYLDFATRMRQINKTTIHSVHIIHCIDYINSHLLHPITINDISHSIGLNKSYLCTLFKQEMGITINTYLLSKRIDTAKDLLAYTSYSSVEISNYLCFYSHSHFIQTFKKFTGTTPKQYRKHHYCHFFDPLTSKNASITECTHD